MSKKQDRKSYLKRWNQRNRKRLSAEQKAKYHADPVARRKMLANSKNSVERLKDRVFAAYGNACECCGETIRDFLTADHKFGWKGIPKSERFYGDQLYRHIERLGYPKDLFQLLCYNCNCGRARYKTGICPHKLLEDSMPVDFLKRPVGGGVAILNVGSHVPSHFGPAAVRVMKMLKVDEIKLHVDQTVKFLGVTVVTTADPKFPLDTALMYSNGTLVGRIVGLPISKEIWDAAIVRENSPQE